ncbi:hypothetical protein BTUL_0002g00520 [Botrytis tulipae]|uniref:Uncharacterized protein n=1 Tax=Botrytis tulipae TaxID=87230 RepID=A0A4Z1FDZ0_9HELO|nr:hypothetical protein BTUL_0002g00520 [Botrytis tulipae]
MKAQTELNVCAELQSALQSQVPASCDIAASHSWGTIIVRELTGSSASKFPQSSQNCTATTGKDYNLSLVQSTRYTGAIDYGVVTRLLLGITPILTVFYDIYDTANARAETHLSCLKVLETKDGEVTDAPQASTGVSGIKSKFWSWKLVIILWVISCLV